MLVLDIPGREKLCLENIVFDYNGTLAVDGVISPATKDLLLKLKEFLNVYILTADTYGNVRKQCEDLYVHIETFPVENASEHKKNIVKNIGPKKTLTVGNGFNDIEMSSLATLSICVLGEEGCSGKLLSVCDLIVKEIEDAFSLILNSKRIIATLRN